MQPQEQYAILWEICKSFSQKIFNSSGNLHHCGRAPLCSDVEIIALSLFAGRTVSVTDAANNTTTRAYDSVHDLPAVVTDAQGNTACYKYDH